MIPFIISFISLEFLVILKLNIPSQPFADTNADANADYEFIYLFLQQFVILILIFDILILIIS